MEKELGIHHSLRVCENMFKITKESNTSTIKSLRIPKDILTKIEAICSKESITFTDFILQACTYCLTELEETSLNKN